jgi:outer membrane lipopolysaccharide assembly protein LptE/RlpB
MELSRLVRVLKGFAQELNERQIPQLLTAVVNSLTTAVQASNPTHDAAFKTSVSNLLTQLDGCPSNLWPPSLQNVLRETGLDRATGVGLRHRVLEILVGDMVTKSEAVGMLNTVVTDVAAKSTQAVQSTQNLAALNIKTPAPPQDDAEVTFLVPSAVFSSNIKDVQRELKLIDQLMQTLAEINGEEAGSTRVEEISKGSLIVVALAKLKTAKSLLDVVTGIIGIWKRIVNLKKTLSQFLESNVPKEVLQPIEQHIDAQLSQGIDELSVEIFQKTTITDAGRVNELKTQFKISAKNLAARIDSGGTVEITVVTRIADAANEATAENQEETQLRRDIHSRGALMRDLPQLEKPMLALPLESPEEPAATSRPALPASQ